MSLRDKIEIEPLGDVRLARIRRGVFEQLDARADVGPEPSAAREARFGAWARASALALAFAAAAALVVFGATHWPRAPQYAGGVSPSRVVTQASGSHLDLSDNAIDLAPESALLTSGDDAQGILLVLERGSVVCEVAPRHGRPPFVVQAGSVRVRVVGTRFTVTRVGDGARVEVAHGIVEVVSAGLTFAVGAGEVWPVEEARSSALPAPGPRPQVAEPPASAAQGRVIARAPSGSGAIRSAPRDSSDVVPSPPPSVDTAPAESAPEPTPQELFEQAAGAEKRDPALAAGIYEQLASGSGPWAANALFAEGRLQADLGRAAQARQTLNVYLARYPFGRNAADARTLLARLR